MNKVQELTLQMARRSKGCRVTFIPVVQSVDVENGSLTVSEKVNGKIIGKIIGTTLNCILVQNGDHTRVIDMRAETYMLVDRKQSSKPVQEPGLENEEDIVSLADFCVSEGISLAALESSLGSSAEGLGRQ